ncbi:hypothetical protein BaRGS_00025156, partial [Batillaria attramentaria]
VYLDRSKQIDVWIARGLSQTRPEFTLQQRQFVQMSWNCMRRDMLKVGIIVFGELFENNLYVRRAFLQHTKGDVGRGREMLKRHVHKVMCTLDKAVSLLDDEARLVASLYEVGTRHVQRNIRMELLDFLVPYIMRSLEPTFERDIAQQLEEAWSNFLKYIMHILKEAMTF